MSQVQAEAPAPYVLETCHNIIAEALRYLTAQLKTHGMTCNSSSVVKDFAVLELAEKEHEVFAVMFLDTQHKLIEYKEMFRGTIDSSAVYPREIAKEALALNAGAMILMHNHPSGCTNPSTADNKITDKIKDAMALLDIRVLDHIIVGGTDTYSYADAGTL